MELVIGIILIVFSVFLIIAVLMQEGKSHNLSGTIAGGADTFFGKSKGQTMSKKLSVLTTIVAIIFALLVCAVYVIQDTGSASSIGDAIHQAFTDDEIETDAAETTVADAESAAPEVTEAPEAPAEAPEAPEAPVDSAVTEG